MVGKVKYRLNSGRAFEHGRKAFSGMNAFDEKTTVAGVVSSGIAQRVAASPHVRNAPP